MSSTSSYFRVLTAITGGTLTLAACGSGGDDSSQPSGSGKTSATASPSGAPTVTPSDSTDLAACADGECEVRVGPSARIPVPRRLGVGSVQVQAVNVNGVTFIGRYIGDDSDFAGSGSYSIEPYKAVLRIPPD